MEILCNILIIRKLSTSPPRKNQIWRGGIPMRSETPYSSGCYSLLSVLNTRPGSRPSRGVPHGHLRMVQAMWSSGCITERYVPSASLLNLILRSTAFTFSAILIHHSGTPESYILGIF